MTVNNEKLDKMYNLANKAYIKCIGNENNHFLKEEINLNEIKIQNDTVKITFLESDDLKYKIETRINLLLDGKTVIGYYSYIVNEELTPVDDFLVFY